MSYFIEPENFYSVLIVGSGPCGLAAAARLREDTPSALFTDEEHHRFHFLRNKSASTNLKGRKSHKVGTFQDRILVLDAVSGQWLGQWRNQFNACEISLLRSPMFFHVDPSDIDGMIAFAYNTDRANELKKIEGVVGKELSKHQQKKNRKKHRPVEIDHRDEKDYYMPSTKLFNDYGDYIVRRYGLDTMVRRTTVSLVEYGNLSVLGNEVQGFRVSTKEGAVFGCRNLILACGPIGKVNYPINEFDPHYPEGSCHTTHIFSKKVKLLPPRLQAKVENRQNIKLVVVGGGLTSAQICHIAIQKGVSKVYFVLRGQLKVKHFDFDLEWVSKYKNYMKSTFWMCDSDEERAILIDRARNGGSVNPEYHKYLLNHESSGSLEIMKYCTISNQEWDDERKTWTVSMSTGQVLRSVDYIVFATGSRVACQDINFLQPIIQQFPIDFVSGYPCLTDNLSWNEKLPLYIMGRMSSLKIGPGAANLEGARAAAERIAWSIQSHEETDLESEVITWVNRYIALGEVAA